MKLNKLIFAGEDKSSLNDPKKTDAVQEDDEEVEDVEQEDVDNDGDKEEGTEEEEEGEEEEEEVEDEPPTTRSQTRTSPAVTVAPNLCDPHTIKFPLTIILLPAPAFLPKSKCKHKFIQHKV